jgi:general stress protein YciG
MSRKRGFAAMSAEQQRSIAALGGRAAHEKGTAHEFTVQEAAEAGRKGGRTVSRNRAHMAEIGRRGGRATHQREMPAYQENAAHQRREPNGQSQPAMSEAAISEVPIREEPRSQTAVEEPPAASVEAAAHVESSPEPSGRSENEE